MVVLHRHPVRSALPANSIGKLFTCRVFKNLTVDLSGISGGAYVTAVRVVVR